MNNYKIFGNKTVDIVIEMGLGACIAEWESLARKLSEDHGVLVYERAGINHSDKSDKERTPMNIAKELMNLLDEIPHYEKLVVIGHSQGGLYAAEFCGIYPEIVKGLILLDPLSIEDNRFKKELTAKELKKSGADKSKNFNVLETLTKFGMKGLVKKAMCQAPPFYYASFSEEQKEDILNSLVNITHLRTCREEASAIVNNLYGDMIDYGAFNETDLMGYITVDTKRLGTKGQYVQLVTFQVSEPFRGMGVGRRLFEKVAGAAKGRGAKKLYISAHSLKESQAAYKALGCVHAEEIIPWIADEEPFDVQLEFVL